MQCCTSNFTEGFNGSVALMTSKPGLQCQIHTSKSGAHTQQGYHVRRCDIASVKDPAGCLFHDKTFKASLWTELIPCHPQTPISLHIHTYVFLNAVIWEKSMKTEVGRGLLFSNRWGVGLFECFVSVILLFFKWQKKSPLWMMLRHQAWLFPSSHPTTPSPEATDCLV